MVIDEEFGSLKPFVLDALLDHIPELRAFDIDIETSRLSQIIDSSDMQPLLWQELAETIFDRLDDFDGFVVLHGTDTMAFTTSALSYILKDIDRPVIFTGSQLPIGILRTDGKENLVTAIEIAAARDEQGHPIVPEVALYFEYCLMRGNRITKYSAEHFDAFRSPNYSILAEAGVDIEYHRSMIRRVPTSTATLHTGLCSDVGVLKLFPGISERTVDSILDSGIQGLVLESFGAGNGPTYPWFLHALETAIGQGLTILNITQCMEGAVQQGRYATSGALQAVGVISGGDMTFEAGLTKLMHGLSLSDDPLEQRAYLLSDVAGERDSV